MANTYCTVCPADCVTALQFPALDVTQDCTVISNYYKSQIQDFLLRPTGAAAPADLLLASLTGVIDNTNTNNTKWKHLVVEGSIPAPTRTEIDLPKGKKATVKNLYTMTLQVKNLSDTNYTFLRALQCGSTNFTFIYGTEAHLFGPVTGIEPESITVEFIQDQDKDAYSTANIIVTWDAGCDPARAANPL